MEKNNFRTSKEILEDDVVPIHTRIDWKKIVIPIASLVCIYILWILLLNLMVNTNSLRNISCLPNSYRKPGCLNQN